MGGSEAQVLRPSRMDLGGASATPRDAAAREADDATTPPTSPALSSSTDETTVVATEIDTRRQRLRLGERKSRLARKANHARMAAQVRALECVLANIMFVADDAAENAASGWSELVLDDDESKRVRAFLRRMTPLEAEKTRLASEQRELRQLLTDHQAFSDVFLALVKELNKENDWNWRVLRWRALTLASFEPWSMAKCDALLEDTLTYMNGFMATNDIVTTGLSFLGWRDRRRHDKANRMIEFSFYKTMHGSSDITNEGLWTMHRNSDAYSKNIIGPNGKVYSEIIQEIDENRCLVRVAEQYPNSPSVIHQVVLLMRVVVDDAFYVIRRSVSVPEVQEALSDTDAMWVTWNFYWTSNLVLDRNASGTCTRYMCATYGTLSTDLQAYAIRWLGEVLFSIVRAESWIRGSQLLLES